MSKIHITRTELVWPRRYNEYGPLKEVPRVNLQTIDSAMNHGAVEWATAPGHLCWQNESR